MGWLSRKPAKYQVPTNNDNALTDSNDAWTNSANALKSGNNAWHHNFIDDVEIPIRIDFDNFQKQ